MQKRDPLSVAVGRLRDDFQARPPVRAWSLIITLYGDAIVPRGGSLWLGSLVDIMSLFKIDAGHVRTAMSRLTADGWLTREKAGRNSYYRLTRREDRCGISRRVPSRGEELGHRAARRGSGTRCRAA